MDLPVAKGVITDILAIQEESVQSMQGRHPPLACPLGEREKGQGNSMLCLHKSLRGWYMYICVCLSEEIKRTLTTASVMQQDYPIHRTEIEKNPKSLLKSA